LALDILGPVQEGGGEKLVVEEEEEEEEEATPAQAREPRGR
jgi:hypothetical protein